ncbi:hypothetical protein GGX14DRAFT_606662 [Mycena pura]|uniref:PPPDE domain-containing protein n=1 Tax=Mycena pura TaxID=153505 RepID=A0AAD6UPF9_9AGAR|nr:hypothetical protein GGX14DRAFT_606662 [Mycena pura]
MSSSEQPSRKDAVKEFLTHELLKGKDELLKRKLKLEHSLGLGPQPNVIPPAVPGIADAPRPIVLGWHPVAGFAGKWFADKTGLGRLLTEKLHKCPDPTQHWAILVGDYVHELWMDENLDIIYLNERRDKQEWHTFEVGSTRFNDEALRRAGEMTIYNMRHKQKAYNLITNNCQNFALQMLNAVQVGKHLEFATAYSLYHAAASGGSGGVSTLLSGQAESPVSSIFTAQAQELPMAEEEESERPPHHVVAHAQEVMDEHTTKLDDHHSLLG